MKNSLILLFSLLVLVAGCNNSKSSGNPGSSPAADQKPSDGTGEGSVGSVSCNLDEACVDWANWAEGSMAGVEQECRKDGGTFANSACPASGRIGRCVYGNQQGVYTMHYYARSGDVNSLKMGCEMSQGKFVAN